MLVQSPDSPPVLLETHYFPSVAYLAACVRTPSVILESCEHFQKSSYRNRCQIATANGVQTLSVPLRKGKNAQQPIRDVQIAYDVDWQRQHWQAIRTAYGSSPFWEFYAPIFERFFIKKPTFLLELNQEILQTFFKILKIDKHTTISLSSTYATDFTEGVDLRSFFSPKRPIETSAHRYAQVFEDRHGFLPHLSGLDLIFCCGNRALEVLQKSYPKDGF